MFIDKQWACSWRPNSGLMLIDSVWAPFVCVPGKAQICQSLSDQSHQPTRSTLGRTQTPPKTAPFSRVGAYNRCTTRKPVICQFSKNGLLISTLTTVAYKKVKICARIQCPCSCSLHPNRLWLLAPRKTDGTIYLGESERRSHLFLFIP